MLKKKKKKKVRADKALVDDWWVFISLHELSTSLSGFPKRKLRFLTTSQQRFPTGSLQV